MGILTKSIVSSSSLCHWKEAEGSEYLDEERWRVFASRFSWAD